MPRKYWIACGNESLCFRAWNQRWIHCLRKSGWWLFPPRLPLMALLIISRNRNFVSGMITVWRVYGHKNKHIFTNSTNSRYPTSRLPQKSTTHMETPPGNTCNINPREARKALREHISYAMKREIKKLVVDMFPRDSECVIRSESADTPSIRRPP